MKQIKKVKKHANWEPRELTENQKPVILKCHLLSFHKTTTNHFLIGLGCVTKSGFYTTTGDGQLSDWTEKTSQSISQSQACTRKRPRPLSGGLLPVRSTKLFQIPAKPLHLRSMLSKSTRCTGNFHTCSWHRSAEGAQLFSTATPNCRSHKQHCKS